MPVTILPEVPEAVHDALLFDVVNDRTVHALAREPVPCGACGAMHQMVTVRRVIGGWTVECVRCDREGGEARGREELERIKLEMAVNPRF